MYKRYKLDMTQVVTIIPSNVQMDKQTDELTE